MEPNSQSHKLRSDLRTQLLSKRRSLDLQTWQHQSQQICNHLADSDLIKNAEVILGFISVRREPDLSYLWQKFPDKTWGFPRCVGRDLEWYRVNPLDLTSTQPGNFGILEPLPTLPPIDLNHVDVILVPAIACDYRGYRLGYGGGFYDRFLSDRIGFTIGVIFADFYLKTIPNEVWDIPTTAVCNENGITLSRSEIN